MKRFCEHIEHRDVHFTFFAIIFLNFTIYLKCISKIISICTWVEKYLVRLRICFELSSSFDIKCFIWTRFFSTCKASCWLWNWWFVLHNRNALSYHANHTLAEKHTTALASLIVWQVTGYKQECKMLCHLQPIYS
jgi:hypothetical protein